MAMRSRSNDWATETDAGWLGPSVPRTAVVAATLICLSLSAAVPAAVLPDGATLFKQRCASCHSLRQVSGRVQTRLPADRRDFLQRFLRTHHVHDDDEREALVSYLTAEASK